MRRIEFYGLLVVLMLLVGSRNTSAQVATGTPPFGSYAGSTVDTVNLANLNVHIDIPILSKAGRGLNFVYALGYDTSIWYPSAGAWVPVSNWGWRGETEALTGYVSASTSLFKCFTSGNQWYFANVYTNWGYHDRFGTTHTFTGVSYSGCPRYPSHPTGTASDGSGYQITAGSGSAEIQDKAGSPYYPPFQSGSGYATYEDTNGNWIKFDGTSTFTDTLGTTALTISGTNPVILSYTAPSGATAQYKIYYEGVNLETNFGCSGISEYGPAQVGLVSEIVLPDGNNYTFTYESTPGKSGYTTGRLIKVLFHAGGLLYTYQGPNDGITCADGSTANLARQADESLTNWTYVHTENGAAWTTVETDPYGNQTTMDFQKLYETERDIRDSSNNLLETILTCYDGNTTNCNSTAVTTPISQKTTFVQLPGTGNLQSRTDTFYNTYGLPTEVDQYAYGTGSPGALLRKTLTTYASLTNDIQDRPQTVTVCSPSGTNAACNGVGTVVAQTSYQYDQGTPVPTTNTPQHYAISGSRGNVTSITYKVSGSASLTKSFTYFDTGNVDVATDVNGAQTTYSYGDCGNSFVTSVSEPLGYTKSMAWDCTGGVETSATDENGKTSSISYTTDPAFWRPNATTDQAGNITTFAYDPYYGIKSVESSMVFNGGNSTTDILKYTDGFGVTYLTQKRQAPTSTYYDTVETDYDAHFRLTRSTLPYNAQAADNSSTAPGRQTAYDALGRVSTVTDSGGGTITNSYTANDALETLGPTPPGENAKSKQTEHDALGRIVSVCEITGGTQSWPGGSCGQTVSATGYLTTYSYDTNGDLIGVTQNAQSSPTQSRSYSYDDLGRMTSETNPESGTANYTYDTDATCAPSPGYPGDLVKKVDNAGNVTCYAYDALHHLLSTTVVSGPNASVTPIRNFVYGPATGSVTVNGVAMTNAVSRLAEAYTCFSPCSTKVTDEGFSYTARGEVSDVYESTQHSGGYYHSSAVYWANGVLNQLGGAAGNNSTYYMAWNVDGEGRVSSTSDSNALTGTTYNNASQPSQISFGSGDSDSYTYDGNTDRMTQYKFTVGSQSLTGVPTWNANGTLQSLAISDPFNSANSQTCTYVHDDLGRIGSTTNPLTTPGVNCVNGSQTVWSQIFNYDPFGNLTTTGNGQFQPGYNESTDQMLAPATYDANGDATNDEQHSYTWDAYGKPATVDGTAVTYDALGRVVEVNSNTQFVYAPTAFKMQIMNGQTVVQNFVPLSGGEVAIYAGANIYFRHPDQLGSSRFVSTTSHTMYYDVAYAPFGQPYAETGTTDRNFTGVDQDVVSGLYGFPARELNGNEGRWPSPDPGGLASVNPADPQSWNRYAYVRNSPLEATDPTGERMTVDPGGSGGSGDDGSYLDGILAADAAWGEDPGAFLFDEMMYGGIGAVDANILLYTYPASLVVISQQQVSEPGDVGIGVKITYQVLDQHGQPFTDGAGDTVTEDVMGTALVLPDGQPISVTPNTGNTLVTSAGEFGDTIAYYGGEQPIDIGLAQVITINGPLAPMTGQQYTFTEGYAIQATGPNQGYILGSNGVSLVTNPVQ